MFKSRHEKRERGGVTEEGVHPGTPLSLLSWRLSVNLNQMVEPNSRFLIDCRADGAVSSPPAETPGCGGVQLCCLIMSGTCKPIVIRRLCSAKTNTGDTALQFRTIAVHILQTHAWSDIFLDSQTDTPPLLICTCAVIVLFL